MPAAPALTAALVPAPATDTCPPPIGLWSPACELHSLPHLALCRGDIYGSFFSTTNRLISSAYVRILSQNKEDRGRSEGGGRAKFHSSHLFTPASLENWNPQSGRGGRRQSGHWMTHSNSHDSQQCPLVQLLPLHIHICTVTGTFTNTHMQKHSNTPSVEEQPWPDV